MNGHVPINARIARSNSALGNVIGPRCPAAQTLELSRRAPSPQIWARARPAGLGMSPRDLNVGDIVDRARAGELARADQTISRNKGMQVLRSAQAARIFFAGWQIAEDNGVLAYRPGGERSVKFQRDFTVRIDPRSTARSVGRHCARFLDRRARQPEATVLADLVFFHSPVTYRSRRARKRSASCHLWHLPPSVAWAALIAPATRSAHQTPTRAKRRDTLRFPALRSGCVFDPCPPVHRRCLANRRDTIRQQRNAGTRRTASRSRARVAVLHRIEMGVVHVRRVVPVVAHRVLPVAALPDAGSPLRASGMRASLPVGGSREHRRDRPPRTGKSMSSAAASTRSACGPAAPPTRRCRTVARPHARTAPRTASDLRHQQIATAVTQVDAWKQVPPATRWRRYSACSAPAGSATQRNGGR